MSTQATEIETAARALPDEARALAITGDADYQLATQFLRERCKAVLHLVNESFDPIIKKSHAAHREALAQKKKVAAPIEEAERITKRLIAEYHAVQERARQKAEAEARKKAQELAEQEALERAAALEDEGRTEEAEQIIEEPIRPAPIVVAMPQPKAEGVSVRKVWRFRVADQGAIKPAFMMPDEKKIGQVVRALGEEAVASVGGIEVYAESVVSAKA